MGTCRFTRTSCACAACLAILWLVCCRQAHALPNLVCEDAHYDFGFVQETQRVVHAFVLRNTGDSPGTVTRVHSTCGCVTIQLGRREIAPGGAEMVTVNFDPKGRRGTQRWAIYVNWMGRESQVIRLTLTGMIARPVTVDPLAIDFGMIPLTGVVQQVVRVFDPLTNQAFRITGVDIKNTNMQCRVTATVPGYDYQLVFTPASAGPRREGSCFATVAVVSTDSPECPSLSIPIHWGISGDRENSVLASDEHKAHHAHE